MRITLNLASRPFADIGPAMQQLRIAMGVLVLLSLGLFLGLHAVHEKAEQARAQEHSLDGAIARITSERQSFQSTMHQPLNAQLLTQAETLNQLFDEKAFSWTLAMESLETVLPGGVQVTAIEPVRNKDGHITLHLRVVGPRDKSEELVKNLEQSRRFLSPRIVGENAETNDTANQRLEPVSASNRFDFDLLAEYNPPVAGERKPAKSSTTTTTTTGDYTNANSPARAHRRLAPGSNNGRPPFTGPSRPAPLPMKPGPGQLVPPAQGGSR
jgi:type IV pilus assembly protein PilN